MAKKSKSHPTAAVAPSATTPPPSSGPAPSLTTLAWSRLAFGPTATELASYEALGKTDRARFTAFVEQQLHPADLADAACDAKLAAMRLTTLGKSLEQLWQDHAVAPKEAMKAATEATDAAKAEKKGTEDELRHRPLYETEIATWMRAVYSRRQLQEILADFWHTHFSIFAPDGQIAPVFPGFDRDVVRAHGLGNFRELLGASARSPAMLFYLNNDVNQSGNPNENYARELFELHTLGAESYLGTMPREQVPGYAKGDPVGYVDGDVYEAARCLTGWRVDTGNKSNETGAFLYLDAWHDRFQKIVLGQRLNEHQPPQKDANDVFDRLVAHPGTARHVAMRLARRLLADEPSPALIAAAADVFHAKRNDKEQLRAVVRTIVLSPEFAATPPAKLRRPFELIAATLRLTGATFAPDEDFLKVTGRCGQRLFQWHTPDGYPDRREKWGASAGMLERWRFCNQLAAGKMPGVTFDPAAATPEAARSPSAIADHWLPRLLGRAPAPATRRAVVRYLAQGRSESAPLADRQRLDRIGPAVALALMSPEFQWR